MQYTIWLHKIKLLNFQSHLATDIITTRPTNLAWLDFFVACTKASDRQDWTLPHAAL